MPDSDLSLFSLGVSVCTHTRQVENQRCSRIGRFQKNHKILGKTQYLMNTRYIIYVTSIPKIMPKNTIVRKNAVVRFWTFQFFGIECGKSLKEKPRNNFILCNWESQENTRYGDAKPHSLILNFVPRFRIREKDVEKPNADPEPTGLENRIRICARLRILWPDLESKIRL